MPKVVYPEHIYDPIRHQIACELLQKECRKLFPHVSGDAWTAIDHDIANWARQPFDYHLEGYLDFWDAFAAMLESIKLKTAFTRLLTAKNYSWSRQQLPLARIHMSAPLEQLSKIPRLKLQPETSLQEIKAALAGHPERLVEQRILNDQHSRDPNQDKFPVVVKTAAPGAYVILDGNRRCLRAMLYGKSSIDTWVVATQTQPPRDYWVPVNDLMQLVELYKAAKRQGVDEAVPAIRATLETYFKLSSIARINYKRVQLDEWATKLLAEPLA